jgi:hypothetical protein
MKDLDKITAELQTLSRLLDHLGCDTVEEAIKTVDILRSNVSELYDMYLAELAKNKGK